MTWAVYVGVTIAGIILFFAVLQWASDRKYKPSREDILEILEAAKNDELNLGQFDEFYSVRIVYDSYLEGVRQRFCKIVDDQRNSNGEFTKDDSTALNKLGKQKIRELMDELRSTAT